MAVTALWYTNAFFSAFGGAGAQIDTESDAMKVSLLTASYTPAQTTHDYFDDVVANEVSSSGYTAGGYALLSLDQAVASLVWNWTAANPSWTSVTFDTRYAVYYDSSPGSDATRPLMSYLNFGATQSLSAVNFSITHDAAGIVKVTVS